MIAKFLVAVALGAVAANACTYPIGLSPLSPCGLATPDIATFAAAYTAAVPSCLPPAVAPYGYPDILSANLLPFAAASCLSAVLPSYLPGPVCGSALPVAPYLPPFSSCF